jgi:hypothetical protein
MNHSPNRLRADDGARIKANCAGYVADGGTPAVFTSLGFNLTNSPDSCHFTGTRDMPVKATAVGLAPLADNGGPTFTRALLNGSPAIDYGNPSGCTDPAGAPLTTDQRGRPRPDGTETI